MLAKDLKIGDVFHHPEQTVYYVVEEVSKSDFLRVRSLKDSSRVFITNAKATVILLRRKLQNYPKEAV